MREKNELAFKRSVSVIMKVSIRTCKIKYLNSACFLTEILQFIVEDNWVQPWQQTSVSHVFKCVTTKMNLKKLNIHIQKYLKIE